MEQSSLFVSTLYKIPPNRLLVEIGNVRVVFCFLMCYNELMDNTVINAIISGVVTLIVAYFGYLKIRKENDLKDVVREQKQMDRLDRIEDKIETLSKKVDIHNGYAEKFGQIGEDIALIKKDIEYLKKG